MQRQQLKRALQEFNLTLVRVEGNFANSTNIVLAAPDGTERRFIINRGDDKHTDMLNRNQFRHFAQDHPALPLVQQEVAQAARKVFAHQPILPPPPPPAPPPEPEPVLKTTLLTSVKPLAKPKVRNTDRRMGQVDFFRLCTLLNNIDMSGLSSLPVLRKRLSDAFGEDVAVSTVQAAMKATGKKLDKQIEATDAQTVIARTLLSLLERLNEPVPEELRAICGPRPE
jgi:hypothetical protein